VIALRLRRLTAVLGMLAVVAACSKKQDAAPAPALQPVGEQVRVRHILVQYRGAENAGPKIVRTKAQADSLIHALAARAANGEDSSSAERGEIAPLRPGDTPPDFEHAAFALKPGETSAIFESPIGFHVIQRLGTERIACEHILIRYHGAQNAPDSLRRTRTEALALTDKILTEVRNPDSSFPVAAETYSDDEQTATRGGYVGEFTRGRMAKQFEDAAFGLAEGEISGIVETPFGLHIIKRVPIETIRVEHILVTHAQSDGLEQNARSEDEALKRALDVAFRAHKGEDFEALAREMSDDKMSGPKGGRLGPISRGQTVPEFEDAAFRLKAGEVSDVVKTRFGFHVIKRIR
jgi:parvulin-like peptidyl-prolyl isomerase